MHNDTLLVQYLQAGKHYITLQRFILVILYDKPHIRKMRNVFSQDDFSNIKKLGFLASARAFV